MGIENWSEEVILVVPADGQCVVEDLDDALERVSTLPVGVVVDLSGVEIMTKRVIDQLVGLDDKTTQVNRPLVLCGLQPGILGIFQERRLDQCFLIVDDRFVALVTQQLTELEVKDAGRLHRRKQ